MTQSDNTLARHAAYRQELARVAALNKAVLFDSLSQAGVTTVCVDFDGEGDSGQIGNIGAFKGEEQAELPDVSVMLHRAAWNSEALEPCPMPLTEAIERMCYDYLEYEQEGWENNDGAFGTFNFDVGKRGIDLDFNGRFVDYTNHAYEF
jgi:hypothetical protein